MASRSISRWISFEYPAAPGYTVEHVFMTASGRPPIAWIALRGIPASLSAWLQARRVVWDLGAVYTSDADKMTLRNIREAFDSIAVIDRGHSSTPRPESLK